MYRKQKPNTIFFEMPQFRGKVKIYQFEVTKAPYQKRDKKQVN